MPCKQSAAMSRFVYILLNRGIFHEYLTEMGGALDQCRLNYGDSRCIDPAGTISA